jgi:hypothetical protein
MMAARVALVLLEAVFAVPQASLAVYGCRDATCAAASTARDGPFPADRCCTLRDGDNPEIGAMFNSTTQTLMLNSAAGCDFTSAAWRIPAGRCMQMSVPPSVCFNMELLVNDSASESSVACPAKAPSALLQWRAHMNRLDTTWQSYLDAPPAKATALAANLSARADAVAAGLASNRSLAVSGDFDVVCSGGGDLNAYYMGIEMVIKRAALAEQRHGGASAGGWLSFELALKGEVRSLENYLSYGLLEEENPVHFATVASAVLYQDHHWRMMATWQARTWESRLATLDGRVFLALACSSHWWASAHQVIVSNYTSPEQAAAAFVGTGAISETYANMSCSDGSETSGPKMTPLFQDGVRQQLIIDLMLTGFPTFEMGFGKFTSTQYAALVERGQDEAAEFLRTGRVARAAGAITLCPKGADVKGNTCGASREAEA